MKKTVLLSLFICITFSSFSQKEIKDYTLAELNQKKAQAAAAKETDDVAVYDAAIMLREELDAAKKVEDYDKAAAIQTQLKALKLKPSLAAKTKELQAEIDKALAVEDYDKAQALKDQITALKNAGEAPQPSAPKPASPPVTNTATAPAVTNNTTTNTNSNSGLTAVNNNVTQNQPTSKSSLTKESIYGSGFTYMGIDFSLINLVSPKKVGQEQKLYKYVATWQTTYDKNVPSKKLAHWLTKSELNDESSNVEGLYAQNLNNRSWIIADIKTISQAEIEKQLSTYKSSHQGIALVMIPGPFDERRHELTLNVVWFDLGSRTIVNMEAISVKATGWPAGLTDATKKYVDDYYKKRR